MEIEAPFREGEQFEERGAAGDQQEIAERPEIGLLERAAENQLPAHDPERDQEQEGGESERLVEEVADQGPQPAGLVGDHRVGRQGVQAGVPGVVGQQAEDQQDGQNQERHPDKFMSFFGFAGHRKIPIG